MKTTFKIIWAAVASIALGYVTLTALIHNAASSADADSIFSGVQADMDAGR